MGESVPVHAGCRAARSIVIGRDDEPTRPRTQAGAELDRQVERARHQFEALLATTRGDLDGATTEEALAALTLTLEELEAAAGELREDNAELAVSRHELERDRQRILRWFEFGPEACLITDLAGVVLHANQQAERLLASDAAELRGTPLATFLHAEDRHRLRSVLDGMRQGPVHGLELRVQPAETSPTPVWATVRRGRDPDGESELRWVLTDGVANTLARDELRDELREARAEVADRDNIIQWQSTLLGASAHDLRNPLAVITGTIETLLQRGRALDPAGAQALLEAAHTHVDELRTVLHGLLGLSRLQLQSAKTDRETVRVHSLVSSALDTVDTTGHRVEIDVPPAVVADVDPGQVTRIVLNLVGNAVDHTPAGTTIRIIAGPAPDDASALLLTVEDDGPGVDDDHKELVFEPFVHLDEAGSSGLGLAIVGMFAAFHGGRAWVGDRDGGGAAFHVLLAHAFGPPQARKGQAG